MRLLRWAGLVAVSVLAVASDVTGAEGPSSRIRQSRLPNGLRVLVEPDLRLPVVSMFLTYGAGTRDDEPGKSGTASLTVNMMWHATAHLGPAQYAERLAANGGVGGPNGITLDETIISATVAANRAEFLLWAWSDQMGFFVPRADAALLAQRRELLKNEYAAKYASRPCGLCLFALRKRLFPPGHPYHREAFVDPHEIDQVTVSDVQNFHDRWMAPDNAVLAVSGEVDPDELLQSVHKYFGPVPASGDSPTQAHARSDSPAARRSREIALEPVQLPGETRVEVAADIPQTRVMVGWVAPRQFTPEMAALEIVSRLLDGTTTALLTWRLVDDTHVALTTDASVHPGDLSSWFVIDVSVPDGVPAGLVVERIDNAIAELAAKYTERDKVSFAVHEAARSFVHDLDSPLKRCSRMASSTRFLDQADWYTERFASYSQVNPQAVRSAIHKYLGKNRVVLVATPTPGAPIAGVVRSVSNERIQ